MTTTPNTPEQARIAGSVRDASLDLRLGLITVAEWVAVYDAAEALGVALDIHTRLRRAALRGVHNAREAGL